MFRCLNWLQFWLEILLCGSQAYQVTAFWSIVQNGGSAVTLYVVNGSLAINTLSVFLERIGLVTNCARLLLIINVLMQASC